MAVKIRQAILMRAKNRKAKYKRKNVIYQKTTGDANKISTKTVYTKRTYKKKKYSYWNKF